jgi:hypothetical protein
MEAIRMIGLIQMIGTLGLILVYLGGAIVSGILINKGARQGGMLTLVGFALLLLNSLCGWIVNQLVFPGVSPHAIGAGPIIFLLFNALIMIVSILLIILGIWVLGTRPAQATTAPTPPRASVGREGRVVEPALEPEPTPPSASPGGAKAYPVEERNSRE